MSEDDWDFGVDEGYAYRDGDGWEWAVSPGDHFREGSAPTKAEAIAAVKAISLLAARERLADAQKHLERVEVAVSLGGKTDKYCREVDALAEPDRAALVRIVASVQAAPKEDARRVFDELRGEYVQALARVHAAEVSKAWAVEEERRKPIEERVRDEVGG